MQILTCNKIWPAYIFKLSLVVFSLGLLSLSFNAHSDNPSNTEVKASTVFIISEPIKLIDFANKHKVSVEQLNQINGNVLPETLLAGKKINMPINSETDLQLPSLNPNQFSSEENNELAIFNGTIINNHQNTESQLAILGQAVGTGNTQRLEEQLTTQQIETVKNNALSIANSELNNQVNAMLGRFGTAETSISIDADGNVVNSEFGVFSPVYDVDGQLVFSEIALRKQEDNGFDRTVGNLGLGYRYYTEEELIGANIFIDHDFTGSNTRLGLGGEYWVDYAKLAANIYTPISQWKSSEQLLEYDERPATGFDVRAQAYLKNYPQLGGSLVFEQYFGDEVGLFGAKNRQSDPYALTAGIDYTPIPLVTAGLSHKVGSGGNQDTRFDLNMNLKLGVPLEEQVNPENVVSTRSLMGSRYDFVDRNNEIIFEFKKRIFEVTIIPTKYRAIADESQYIYTLDELIDFESSHTSPSKITSYRWTITPFEPEISSTSDILTFKPTRIGRYSVRLELTNENGITAYSKPVLVQVISPAIRLDTIVIDFINRTEGLPLFDFNNDGEISVVDTLGDIDSAANRGRTLADIKELKSTEPYNHHYIHFTVTHTDKNGLPIEIAYAPIIQYAIADIQDILGKSTDKLILVNDYRDKTYSHVWHFVVATTNVDISDVPFFAQIGNDYSIDEMMIFEKDPPPIPNREIFRITLREMGVNGDSPGEIVLDTNPLGPISKPIKQDTYYEAKVYAVSEVTRFGELDWLDITAQVQHSLVWRYFNPAEPSGEGDLSVQTADQGYFGLEQCRGFTKFSTQVNNFQNNEMAWGEIGEIALQNAETKYQAGIDVLTEQYLELAVQFDKSSRMIEKTELDDTKTLCSDEVPASIDYYEYLLKIANTEANKG